LKWRIKGDNIGLSLQKAHRVPLLKNAAAA